jgi:hypothetical protein
MDYDICSASASAACDIAAAFATAVFAGVVAAGTESAAVSITVEPATAG